MRALSFILIYILTQAPRGRNQEYYATATVNKNWSDNNGPSMPCEICSELHLLVLAGWPPNYNYDPLGPFEV